MSLNRRQAVKTLLGTAAAAKIPTHELLEGGTLREVFFYNQAAYHTDDFHPSAAARLEQRYLFGRQVKQKLVFQPISFNPASGELLLRNKIRIRIDFIDSDVISSGSDEMLSSWMPPAAGEEQVFSL